jgi:hypothetical protein
MLSQIPLGYKYLWAIEEVIKQAARQSGCSSLLQVLYNNFANSCTLIHKVFTQTIRDHMYTTQLPLSDSLALRATVGLASHVTPVN